MPTKTRSFVLIAPALLACAEPAHAAPKPGQAGPAHARHTPARSAVPAKPAPPPVELSEAGARVADWVTATADNRDRPWIIVDKPRARIFVFAPGGRRLADAPVLIGRALGDEATPAIGRKSLAEIGPAEKTTPAGRFLARFGRAVGHPVLWVDYSTSVALHPIPPANKEHRARRIASPEIADNRITFGCINVPKAFYARVHTLFRKNGGYVYVLPDIRPLGEVFPLAVMTRATDGVAANPR